MTLGIKSHSSLSAWIETFAPIHPRNAPIESHSSLSAWIETVATISKRNGYTVALFIECVD